MKMKKRILSLCLVLMLLAGCAGCASGAESDGEGTKGAETAETAEEANAPRIEGLTFESAVEFQYAQAVDIYNY